MNPRKHSRLRNMQLDRQVARFARAMARFICDENKDAIDNFAANLIVYGRSPVRWDGDKLVCDRITDPIPD